MEDITDVLSKKITLLFEHIKKLKAENSMLAEENIRLNSRVHEMQTILESDAKKTEHLDQQRVLAKLAIDELVENIDSILGKEQQSQ